MDSLEKPDPGLRKRRWVHRATRMAFDPNGICWSLNHGAQLAKQSLTLSWCQRRHAFAEIGHACSSDPPYSRASAPALRRRDAILVWCIATDGFAAMILWSRNCRFMWREPAIQGAIDEHRDLRDVRAIGFAQPPSCVGVEAASSESPQPDVRHEHAAL